MWFTTAGSFLAVRSWIENQTPAPFTDVYKFLKDGVFEEYEDYYETDLAGTGEWEYNEEEDFFYITVPPLVIRCQITQNSENQITMYAVDFNDTTILYRKSAYPINAAGELITVNGAWVEGYVDEDDTVWYEFPGTNGTQYSVYWDDIWDGSGTYSGDALVYAYREDLMTTYFEDISAGYTTPQTFTALATETIYIIVEEGNTSGTFAIQVNSP